MADITKVQDPEKLYELQVEFAATGNLSRSAKKVGVKEQTAFKWKRSGFLDPSSHENAMAMARRITTERMLQIAENSYCLVEKAQRQVEDTIDEASAKDASRVAVEQFSIAQLASGQATSRVEHYTRQNLAHDLEEIFGEDVVIDGEFVEEAA